MEGHPTHELPNGFFSDPFHIPVIPEFPSDESDNDTNDINPAKTTTSTFESRSLQAPSTSVLDLEYDLFQRGYIESTDHSQTYDQATIVAGPVLASSYVPGLPTTTAVSVPNEDNKDTRDYEERELIMDRILEEERAQEDADMRVQFMKNKIEGLKKRREAMKALKVQLAGKSST